MTRVFLVALAGLLLMSSKPADATERPVRLVPSLGFGWSTEEGVDRTPVHFRMGALLEVPIGARFSTTVSLRDHVYQREYVLDRLALSGDALGRTRLAEQKVDADAALRVHLAAGRFRAAAGVGPGFRFFLNSALPSSLGGPMARADVAFAISPSVDLTAGAAYTHNVFFANDQLLSAMGPPRSATSYGGALALAFPANLRFNVGYEGEAVAMERSMRFYHSVVFLLATSFGAPQPPPAPEPQGLPQTPPAVPPPVISTPVETTGSMRGVVRSAANNRPLADVIIEVPGRTRLLTDSKGVFELPSLLPGQLRVAAAKDGFIPSEAKVEVRAGAATEVALLLVPRPIPPPPTIARLRGTVVSERDKPLDTLVGIPSAGIAPRMFAKGEYELEVPAGELSVEASAEGFLKQGRRITARAGETVVADFVLKEAPKRVLVILRKEKIEIKKQVHFATNKDVILPDSYPLLDEIAAIILENPQLARIRIEGHTDSQADDAYNLSLSDRRAQAVKRALVERGVESGRLVAVGFGETQPVASNKSAKGRAANRRVELMIEQAPQ